jgi:hypothetical protein
LVEPNATQDDSRAIRLLGKCNKLTGRRIQIEAVLEAAAIGLGADLEWGEFFAVYERASSDASAWLHEAQQAAGRPQETGKWKAQYAVRAGVEETLARLGN